jgi:hypothetical protein
MNLSATLRFLRSPPRCLPGSGRQQFPQLRRAQIAVVLLGEENIFLGGAGDVRDTKYDNKQRKNGEMRWQEMARDGQRMGMRNA